MATTAVVPRTDGLLAGLAYMLSSGSQWATPNVGLYSVSIVPGYTTVIGDLTECTFTGYSRFSLSSGWGSVIATGDGIHVQATAIQVASWTYTGGGTSGNIYGYFGVDPGTGALLWVSNPSGTPLILAPGQSAIVQPTALMSSEY